MSKSKTTVAATGKNGKKHTSALDGFPVDEHSCQARLIRNVAVCLIGDVETMQEGIEAGTVSAADRQLVDGVMRQLGVLVDNWRTVQS